MSATKDLTLPSLRLSEAQKKKNDYLALKRLADHYVSKSDTHHVKSDYGRLRRLANNEVDIEDYKSMLSKYNYNKLNSKKQSEDLKSIPLISVIMRMLFGEKRISPLNFNTKVNNEDVQNKFLDSQEALLNELVDQQSINALNANGFGTNIPSQEGSAIDQAIQQHAQDHQDARAEAGQEILDGIIEEKDIKERFFSAYKDWITLGTCFTLKGVSFDDLDYDAVTPEQCFVEPSGNSPYAEDGQAGVVSQQWNIADVVRRFGPKLKDVRLGGKDDKKTNALDWLSSLIGIDGMGDPRPTHFMTNEKFEDARQVYSKVHGNTYGLGTRTIDVHTVMINLISPVQVLSYIDELGLPQEMEVPEDYVLNEANGDIELETIEVNDVWKVVKIGNSEVNGHFAMYPIIERVEPQRTELNNSSTGKLPLNGRVDGLSVPKVLEEFQYQYNLVHLMESRTLAKNGNKPMILPISAIPDNPTWGKTPLDRAETLLYYRDTFNAIIIDDSKMNPALMQIMKAIDMSTLDAVEKFIGLKEQIKASAWEAIGVNRQRQGETYASDGKATNEQALIRSSIMTADFNISFNKFESSELLGLLDYSKHAYINGKTFTKYPTRTDTYISDKTRSIFELDTEEHSESQYGISVAVAHLDNKKLDTVQQLAQPFLQNGVTAYQAYKAITTENPSKAEDYLKQAYEVQRVYEEEQAAADRASAEKVSENNLAATREGYQNNIDVANIKADIDQYKVDVDAYAAAVEGGAGNAEALKAGLEAQKLNIERQRVANEGKKINNDFKLGKEANSIARIQKKSNSNS